LTKAVIRSEVAHYLLIAV